MSHGEVLTSMEGFAIVPSTTPFLRWAGGKRWLLPRLRGLLGGLTIDTYFEPFLGGGSVFLSAAIRGKSFLSDLNCELIEVYEQVRARPREVAKLAAQMENTADEYYRVRAAKPTDSLERAANFVFLNHTSFNGIHRVNLRGEYNVPFGRRASPNLPTAEHLEIVAKKLERATLSAGDFEAQLHLAGPGSLVFLDPPYTVAHNQNGFIKYNQHLFSFSDQQRLASAIGELDARGAKYVLTNAAHASIVQLFGGIGRTIAVSRGSSIGGKEAARGRADELVFTNIM
jgi:DNA adenine methylase